MAVRTYQHDTQVFDPETGEITIDTKYSISAINNEEDYIKVYKYLNTVFAFKGINKALIPTLMEISNYMTFADKGQEVQLNKYTKEKIADSIGISLRSVNNNIVDLKKADILRPIARGVYAVNPFIIGRGKWSDIKELRAQFDFDTGLMKTQSVVSDKITGETMAKITREEHKRTKQIPGQLSLDLDGMGGNTTDDKLNVDADAEINSIPDD